MSEPPERAAEPEGPRDPAELKRARVALIHTLANCLAIVTANLPHLRELQMSPEAHAILDDMAAAVERALRAFESLRKLA